jgi:hypothetical protein
MSKLQELFTAMESHEFSAIVNLASDFKTFVRILASEKPVQDLAEEMREAKVRAAVSERALALVKDQGEEGYEHPWDSALAAYLWLLADKDPELAKVAAATIAQAPRCWWARKLAEKVLSPERFPSSAGSGSPTLFPHPPPQQTGGITGGG